MHTRTYVLACTRTGGRTRIRVGGVFRTNSATNGKLEDEVGVARAHAECLTNARNMVMKVYYCCMLALGEDFCPQRSRLVTRIRPKMTSASFHG